MRPTILLICMALLPPFLFAATSSSENYQFTSTTLSSGGGNVSSSSYKQDVAVGIISGILDSASYLNHLGFFHTLLLANGQPCTSGNQCEGGYCCSNLCAGSACPSGASVSSSGGGSAGGGGGGGAINISRASPTQAADLFFEPQEIHLTLALGENASTSFMITNNGTFMLNGSFVLLNLEDFASISLESFTNLSSNESINGTLFALGRRLGSHLGKIEANAGLVTRSADVILDIKSDQVLFDVSMDIPSAYKTLERGEPLLAQLTLFNVGVARDVDVLVTYLIKDTTGMVVSEESESFAVISERSYVHEFALPELETGKYLASAEVRYENSFAVSSDTFSIVDKGPGAIARIAGRNATFFIALLVLAGILYMVVSSIIVKKGKEKKFKKKRNKK